MTDTEREVERKYEATPETRLPDLTGAAGVSSVVHLGLTELDAVYYDTEDLQLAAGSLTLRRRTGGDDAGWHLKVPVSAGVRDEIRAPLGDDPPAGLAALVRSRVRHAGLVPVVRLLSARDVHRLLDADGALLAELGVDEVLAERLTHEGRGTTSAWTELEVELADDADPAVLDAVEARLREAGILPSEYPSKLARALAGTAPTRRPETGKAGKAGPPRTAGDHVLAYVRRQTATVVRLDPAVRRGLPDSVHSMRVATRRLRSAFRTYRGILDRTATDPLRDELKWLAGELGACRDQEVLDARLRSLVAGLPDTLVMGPVSARLARSSAAAGTQARRRVLDVLDSGRYLALLDALDTLADDPPLRPGAARDPDDVLPRAVLKDYDRLAARVAHALDQPPGPERDVAMHEARKATKRVRYAADLARPALGAPARKLSKRMKSVQSVLGDHQDGVMAREALRTFAVQAHGAGESAFTWGLLYGREEAEARERERELPGVWARASRRGPRRALEG